MGTIILGALNGPDLDEVSQEFDFKPERGEEMLLRCGGKLHSWRVVEVFFLQRLSGGVGTIAHISWEGRVGSDSPKRRHLRLVSSEDEAD